MVPSKWRKRASKSWRSRASGRSARRAAAGNESVASTTASNAGARPRCWSIANTAPARGDRAAAGVAEDRGELPRSSWRQDQRTSAGVDDGEPTGHPAGRDAEDAQEREEVPVVFFEKVAKAEIDGDRLARAHDDHRRNVAAEL